MDVLIKGMEMPKNCCECPCYYAPEESWEKECSISKKEWYIPDKKPNWCPLVPVPNHGRLVDADEAIKNMFAGDNRKYDIGDLAEYLSECSTIIP